MIRLKFVDTFCDSLQELKHFLSAHAEGERNLYHVSVSKKFRSGLIEKWLLQEASFQTANGNESEASLLQSLANAVHQAKNQLTSDREVYSWMMRVFCSQTDASPSVNPFRFIDVKKLIACYYQKEKALKGHIDYEVTDVANESFNLMVSLNNETVRILRVPANLQKGVDWKIDFDIPIPMALSGENLALLSFALDNHAIPGQYVFVYMGTGIEDVYYASHDSLVFVAIQDVDGFVISKPEIVTKPEDDYWALRKCGYFSQEDLWYRAFHEACKALEQKERQALSKLMDNYNYRDLLECLVNKDELMSKEQEGFISNTHRSIDKHFYHYAVSHMGFPAIGPFNINGVAPIIGSNRFISFDGRILIPFFNRIWLVGEGLAAIKVSSGKLIFVSINGEERIRTEELSDLSVFSDGYLAVRRASTKDWGYMKKDGTIIGSYEIAGDFRNGQAIVFKKDWMGDRWLTIDTSFNETVCSNPPQEIIHFKSPDSLDGMSIKETNNGYGLFSDDGYPIPVLFNLPELGHKLLSEL